MTISLNEIVVDLASAFKLEDSKRLQPKRQYHPGIGSYDERAAVKSATKHLCQSKPDIFSMAEIDVPYPNNPEQKCDFVIPDAWAIEFKLLRPFNNNGTEAIEQWVQNVLHPYPKSAAANSVLADYVRLGESSFSEQKAIVIYGFEHKPPVLPLDTVIQAFELIARRVVGLNLGQHYEAHFTDLVHPVHQQGTVFGWVVE